ncbi:MAG: protein phosphatase 2C domain-containing protein [Saprospiraceae bacterium]
MKKYEISKIGEFHTNHNEDSSSITEIGDDKIMIAVMDGCSMGKESHFASTLIAKLLRKIGKEISFRLFAERTKKETSECLKEVLQKLFEDLKQMKNKLHLEREEILSTLILGIFDKQKKEIELITVGDGLICCNGQLTEYEQDDKPDYLGYHLVEEFRDWFQSQTQKLSLKNVEDLSISTDGIFTFKNFDGKEYAEITEEEIVKYLLIDDKGADEENMLKKKILEIENKFGLKPSDDLTIIRIKIE